MRVNLFMFFFQPVACTRGVHVAVAELLRRVGRRCRWITTRI